MYPSEIAIERVMREEGFQRMQAINHLRIMDAGQRKHRERCNRERRTGGRAP